MRTQRCGGTHQPAASFTETLLWYLLYSLVYEIILIIPSLWTIFSFSTFQHWILMKMEIYCVRTKGAHSLCECKASFERNHDADPVFDIFAFGDGRIKSLANAFVWCAENFDEMRDQNANFFDSNDCSTLAIMMIQMFLICILFSCPIDGKIECNKKAFSMRVGLCVHDINS